MKGTIKETHVQNFPTGAFSKKGKKKYMKVATLTFALQQNINKNGKTNVCLPTPQMCPLISENGCFMFVIDEKTKCSNIFCCEGF